MPALDATSAKCLPGTLSCNRQNDSSELPAGLMLSPGPPGTRGPVCHSCLVRTASEIPL
jgi:hypothetical protein